MLKFAIGISGYSNMENYELNEVENAAMTDNCQQWISQNNEGMTHSDEK